MPQRRLAARPTRRQGAMRVAAASGEALVVGSSGQTAARVVVSLLRAGFKVTAGVDTDIDETREVVQFAKKLEILSAGEAGGLKLAEFNPLDADSVGTVLKRGARVVLVAGDQAGSRRPDMRIYDAVLDALLENGGRIGQLVVVTPLGGGGTAMFGGGRGGGGSRLSPLEQRVASSGVPYLLIRAAPSDRVTDRYGEEANVVVEGVGGLPAGLSASRSQVAAVVAAAMAQARGNAIIEVGASPAAPSVDLASQVAEALAAGQQVEEEEEEEAAAPAAMPAFFTIGGSRKKPAPVEEEEEEAPAPAKPAFFTIGGSKRKAAPVVEEEEEEAPAKPARKPAFAMFGGGGTRKVVREPVAAEEEEAPAKPARKPAFSFGTVRMSKQQKAAAVEEEEAPAPKKAFAFGTVGSRAKQQTEVEEAPATRRIIRGRKPVAAEPEKPAPRAAPKKEAVKAEAGAKKNGSGGFLGFLGVSQETIYADEA
ncbi:hypothetical protein CHLNCDRAFT_134826 [Chlorella variabilis]|uniref:NAD(P)-binding domain-containing protein n=1 Tax=Chlorella variabilis TaxID=554065 RepID=E1ZGV9_CHLVA|nr:hypothetical protein CHLNCDRAFT_134826 [Chlorella variabilis]EFN55007.1 hypothetical protein CHLNCDRAFT_134826 [Chlorella variabilis]|eukprot:XP_005847109.1 hypothetical protein CHLNCDRAFT_134826 [Chlorella variabilis]